MEGNRWDDDENEDLETGGFDHALPVFNITLDDGRTCEWQCQEVLGSNDKAKN
jgi:hypothetical protein